MTWARWAESPCFKICLSSDPRARASMPCFAAAKFLALMGQITAIPNLLYDPDYVGGGTHENLHGQDLDPHVDFSYHPKSHRHRRLNLIVFLNPECREEWGGAFELHVNPWLPPEENPLKTVAPLANRCLILETSENSWHGFKRINLPPENRNLSRRSIAVYYYTRRRPASETAPGHSTIYVQRPLPEHIRAGHILSRGRPASAGSGSKPGEPD